MNLDRVILIDKPAGITSFGVVSRVRRQLTEQLQLKKGKEQPERKPRFSPGATRKTVSLSRIRVGHTGTLDPFATGLLILLSGKMTKKSDEFLKLDKVYEATIELGATSTTGDPEGEVTNYELRRTKNAPSHVMVEKILESFTGEIEQIPPVYSAIKVDGQRAYKLARQGKQVEMPTRQVIIHSIELLEFNFPELKIRVHCSSGTYIRTLAEDIGKALGTGAYTKELRRLKVGNYDVADADKSFVIC